MDYSVEALWESTPRQEADKDGGKSLFVEPLQGSHQCVRRKGITIQRIVLVLVSSYSRRWDKKLDERAATTEWKLGNKRVPCNG